MQGESASPFATAVADRIRAARNELTARWLERIVARVSVDPNRVFPTDDLLDHMPLLVEGIGDFIGSPAEPVAAQPVVIDRARELGALRFAQGFAEHELQKEYELLGGVLFTFVRRVADETGASADAEAVLSVSHRIFQAIAHVQQATTSEFLRHVTAELREREGRLQAFHQALTHEIRNRIGATLGAGQLLTLAGISDAERDTLAAVVVRNATGMRAVLDNLLELTRLRIAPRQQRNVRLPEAAAEAARQLREAAELHGVAIRIAPDLPDVDVNAAAAELCLSNLISNAIKYSDPAKPERWVEVSGQLTVDVLGHPTEVMVAVTDNGFGVPEGARAGLFHRFFRAHASTAPGIEGTGLGLSIVREIMESLGGSAWAEFPAEGSRFLLTMPCRRAADAINVRPQTTRSEA
ncbi:MAG TPA: HAMP domain-containing sensor histidine kinase [Gemmatimonadaceae bacterium]